MSLDRSVARLGALAHSIRATLENARWLPALLVRLFVGYFFFETGLAKTHDLATMTERFTEWGIPAPAFNAALSAYTEMIGGALVLVGLGTRVVSIPMVINMIVAILSVKLADVHALSDFVELDEPLYGLAFFWLIFVGPGQISLDYLVDRALTRRTTPPQPAPARSQTAS